MDRARFRLLFAGCWALALPVIVQAAAAPASGESKADMFTLALDLGVWTLVVFFLLLFVLKKYAWGPMLEGLSKREQNIRAAIDEAQKAREEAQKAREELKVEMGKANEKVRELIEEARRDAQRLKEEIQAQGQAEVQANRDRLYREIQTAKDQVIQEMLNNTAQLATLAASKIIRRELSADDHRQLIDEALTELAQANVGWKDRLPQ